MRRMFLALLALPMLLWPTLSAAAIPAIPPAAPVPQLILNGIVWLGDSRVAREYNTTGAPTPKAWKWDGTFMTVGHALAGQRLTDLGNFATSGYRSDQYLTSANIGAALATRAKYAAIYGCYNDIIQNYPTAATSGQRCASNIESACNAFTAQGRTCIIIREPCALPCASAQIAQMMMANTLFDTYRKNSPSVLIYDQPGSVRDYNVNSMTAFKPCYVAATCITATANSHGGLILDGMTSTSGILAGYLVSGPCIQGNTIVSSVASNSVTLSQGAANTTSACPVLFQSTEGGGIHELNLGGWMDGVAWAAFESQLIPNPPPRNIEPFTNAGGQANQQLSNPLFLITAGGSAATGTTGAVPASWGTALSNATAAVSTFPRPDGFGNNFQMVITPNATPAYAKLYESLTASNFAPGDKVQASCEVNIAAGSSNLVGVELYIQVSVDGAASSEIASDGSTDPAKGSISQTGFSMVRQTDPQVIPAGAIVTSISMNVRIWFSGASSTNTTANIGKCELHKVV